jgi:AcrR family transcriptional regulator
VDKRVLKTRSAIFNAVFDLSTEKDLEKITVIELCERAGINKSTFYLHYKSIDDCFKKCFDAFTSRVLDLSNNINYTDVAVAPEDTVDNILNAVEEDMVLINKFRNSVIYDAAIRNLKEQFINAICQSNGFDAQNNYHQVAKVTFLVGGCLDALTQLLPDYNRKELKTIMVDVIKRKDAA